MRIIFTRFPLESAFGGAEVQTLLLAEGFRERGHDVELVGSCPILLEEFKKRNLPAHTLKIGSPPVTKFGSISFLWRKKRMQKKLIAQSTKLIAVSDEPTTILMLSLTEKLLLTDWAVEQGWKVLWIEHDRVSNWLRLNPWLPRLRSLSQKVTTIGVSDLSRDLYIELGFLKENVLGIPNGIDLDRFKNLRNDDAKPNFPHLHIGCIARLTFDKGTDVLVEAIVGEGDIHLTIVGEGKEKRRVHEKIDEYGIHDRITLLPTTSVEEFYKNIDVLVLPSRDHDPFGLVVAEAMAAGIPTICTEACGITAHFDEDVSLISKPGDVGSLRNAIRILKKPSAWTNYAKSGKLYAEHFSVQNMLNAYEEIITHK